MHFVLYGEINKSTRTKRSLGNPSPAEHIHTAQRTQTTEMFDSKEKTHPRNSRKQQALLRTNLQLVLRRQLCDQARNDLLFCKPQERIKNKNLGLYASNVTQSHLAFILEAKNWQCLTSTISRIAKSLNGSLKFFN